MVMTNLTLSLAHDGYKPFRPGMDHFFSSSHLSTLVLLFLLIIKIYLSYILFGHSSSQSVSQWNSFSPLKYIVYKCYSCFRQGMGHFFHRYTCLHLSRFFCCIIKKYLSHILFWSLFVSVCFVMKLLFAFKIHCLQMLQLFQTRDGPVFFHRHTCLHLSRFFAISSKNIYPIIILFWSQFVSVCFAMKLFFSFKIQCLQRLQLFQTRDVPIFFIVTLDYTCRTFFAVSSENVCPIYSFVHSLSQSVLQWNSFSPLKYIVYKCYICFRPGMGQFFHHHTCRAFFAASAETTAWFQVITLPKVLKVFSLFLNAKSNGDEWIFLSLLSLGYIYLGKITVKQIIILKNLSQINI